MNSAKGSVPPLPSSLGKRTRSSYQQETWENLHEKLAKSRKDDFSVKYFFTSGPAGTPIQQADRDFVAQAMEYFSFKSKRDPVVVNPPLSIYVQGVTNNLDANTPVRVVFKTVKHLHEMYLFLQSSRVTHHDMIVNFSVDGSGYIQSL